MPAETPVSYYLDEERTRQMVISTQQESDTFTMRMDRVTTNCQIGGRVLYTSSPTVYLVHTWLKEYGRALLKTPQHPLGVMQPLPGLPVSGAEILIQTVEHEETKVDTHVLFFENDRTIGFACVIIDDANLDRLPPCK